MRLLRWASELAVSDDERKAELGVEQLSALADSDLLGEAEKAFVDAALESALVDSADEIEEIEQAGEDVQVVQLPLSGGTEGAANALPSSEAGEDGSDG